MNMSVRRLVDVSMIQFSFETILKSSVAIFNIITWIKKTKPIYIRDSCTSMLRQLTELKKSDTLQHILSG